MTFVTLMTSLTLRKSVTPTPAQHRKFVLASVYCLHLQIKCIVEMNPLGTMQLKSNSSLPSVELHHIYATEVCNKLTKY